MLRYFYLLCFLVCIECTFCYEFTSDGSSNHQRLGSDKLRHRRKSVVRGKRQNHLLQLRTRQDPKAHIDVASFIQQPEVYKSLGDGGLYENKYKREKSSSEYEVYDSLSDPQQSSPELNENSNNLYNPLDPNSRKMPDSMPMSSYADAPAEPNPLQNKKRNSPHKKAKKSKLKRMKFPFFSRKKAVTLKPKKNKKRRLFSFHHSSKATQLTTGMPKMSNSNPLLQNSHSLFTKRMAPNLFCPLCKRKIPSKVKKKKQNKATKTPHKIIHNSRQYFQEASELNSKPKKETVKYDDFDDNDTNENCYKEDVSNRYSRKHQTNERRRKRDENYDRERQLKELEQVQKKIDSVDTTPYNRPK